MKINFFDAVDVVCLDCHYLSEETCATCPVRKTCDEKQKEIVGQNKKGEHHDCF